MILSCLKTPRVRRSINTDKIQLAQELSYDDFVRQMGYCDRLIDIYNDCPKILQLM